MTGEKSFNHLNKHREKKKSDKINISSQTSVERNFLNLMKYVYISIPFLQKTEDRARGAKPNVPVSFQYQFALPDSKHP